MRVRAGRVRCDLACGTVGAGQGGQGAVWFGVGDGGWGGVPGCRWTGRQLGGGGAGQGGTAEQGCRLGTARRGEFCVLVRAMASGRTPLRLPHPYLHPKNLANYVLVPACLTWCAGDLTLHCVRSAAVMYYGDSAAGGVQPSSYVTEITSRAKLQEWLGSSTDPNVLQVRAGACVGAWMCGGVDVRSAGELMCVLGRRITSTT